MKKPTLSYSSFFIHAKDCMHLNCVNITELISKSNQIKSSIEINYLHYKIKYKNIDHINIKNKQKNK